MSQRSKQWCALFLWVALWVSGEHVRGDGGASFSALGDLPGGPVFTQVSAVSGDGRVVVGRSAIGSDGFNPIFEAFRWTAGEGLIGMGDLDGGNVESRAIGVSSNGTQIVGETDSGGFIWTASTGMLPLFDPPGELSGMRPFCVTNNGSVVLGFSFLPMGGTVGARWTPSTGIENLGALPNPFGTQDAFLWSCSADGTGATGNSLGEFVQPLHWTASGGMVGLGDVPGGIQYALGEGMSADGSTIVGNARLTIAGGFPRDEAFLWRGSTGFNLLDPMRGASFGSTANACSGDGSIAVGYFGGVNDGAMVWDAKHGMRSIRDRLEDEFALGLGDWLLGTAVDVSDDGTVIVGNGLDPAGETAAWIAHLPRDDIPKLPAYSDGSAHALLLSIMGAAAFVLSRRMFVGTATD